MDDNNGYIKNEYGWWWGYSKDEIEVIRKRFGNPRNFAQEYGLEFLASGRNVFPPEMVKRMRKHVLRVGDETKDYDGNEWTVKEEDRLII